MVDSFNSRVCTAVDLSRWRDLCVCVVCCAVFINIIHNCIVFIHN